MKRFFVRVAACALILAAVVPCLLGALCAGHVCQGESCPCCLAVRRAAQGLFEAACLWAACLCACAQSRAALGLCARAMPAVTPVSRRVRMND